MKTDQYIAALLYDHDCVIITDFGGLVASYKSSQWNAVQNIFYPPSKKIAFNASLKNNDGLLANYIATKQNIFYNEACGIIRDYVEDCFKNLNEQKKFTMERIGDFYFDKEKNIQFVPDANENFLKDSFGLSYVHSAVLKAKEPVFSGVMPALSKKKSKILNWRIMELIPAAAIVIMMFTFPVITKNFQVEISDLNPFNYKFKTEKNTPAIVKSQPEIKPIAPVNKSETTPEADESQKSETPLTDTNENKIPENINPEINNVNNTTAATELIKENAVEPPVDVSTYLNYHIVVGCFRIEENALKLEADLKSKGYKASILGRNEQGLTMVSAGSFGHLAQAKNSLSEIQDEIIPGAWILKKK